MGDSRNTDTPLKTIFRGQSLEPHCFICFRSPSGKLRNIITNVALPLPENNAVLQNIKKCLDITFHSISFQDCKICLSCKRQLENCVHFQNILKEAINRKSTSTCSTKRMAFSQTPTLTPSSTKKENTDDVNNKENVSMRKTHSKKKKKLQFLELETDVPIDTNKSQMCHTDHNYGSLASPLDTTHLNSVKAKQELFCKKDDKTNQSQCCSADDVFKNKVLLSEIQKLILLETEVIADNLCSLNIQPGPSVLRTLQHPSPLKSEDILHKCLLEFQNCFPFVFRVFQTLTSPLHADQQKTATGNSTIAMMYAMAMNKRNKDLCAMQKINTCIALRFHAGNDLLDIFNKTGITLSADSKYTFLDKMGDLNTEGIVRSIQLGIGGKVTVDNIDGMTIARDVRLTGGNKHYHYTASTYYPDRVDLRDLEQCITSSVPEEINFDVFYLSAEEESKLKEMYGYMVGRTLVKHFKSMKWMQPCIPSHIPHPYSQQMSSKSQIFPLKEMTLRQLK
ncbi:uncharacterized protein LOC134278881 isoform X1 [Saccostrea cucullata]|uniref:uncharacterized protein LOC134278881 isoform X1 n=1 Tax=Saccostrea cuccullata TaxID=36930 RepID=UPI002ED3A902